MVLLPSSVTAKGHRGSRLPSGLGRLPSLWARTVPGMAVVRPCLVHRCPEYAVTGQSYCKAHLYRRNERGLTGARGTSGQWRKIRKLALQHARYRCADCRRKITDLEPTEKLEVHHVDGDSSNNVAENLKVLCTRCHKDRHRSRLKV
jgi:5-methylcytosine-specific restriction endonuclease McrA